MLALFISLNADAALNTRDLNHVLKEKNAGWVAGPSWVTDLDETSATKLMGLKLSEASGDLFYPDGQEKMDAALPASIDWRNKDGRNYVSPVLNQAYCGSCVAFAAVGTFETQLNIARKTSVSAWALSAQHLFACGGGGCEKGWTLSAAGDFLKTKGIPDEACFPYKSGSTGKDYKCTESCGNAASRVVKATNFSTPTYFFVNASALKTALQKGPLMVGMSVYEDFLSYKTGVYKHVTGKALGGHAVTLVGYDDSKSAWIARNSWGEEWGDKGYFLIAYKDASNFGAQSVGLEVSSGNGHVVMKNVAEFQALKGNFSIEFESTYPNTQSIEWVLDKDHSPVAYGDVFGKGRAFIDTTQYADGVYTLIATANHKDGQAFSAPRRVIILNGELEGDLKITNITPGQKLSKEIEFKIEINVNPVPLTRIIYHAKNVATGEEILRSTNNPLDKMLMFWRTQYAPNGEYDITLEGRVGDIASITSDPIRVTVSH